MNMRTKGGYFLGGQFNSVDIFGYASKGIPGIEILGIGKHGRMIKEKFVYLSREKKIKFPCKRFVLCIEGDLENKKFKEEEFRYLELPLLIMLWSLSGELPVSNLDDCFSIGKISVIGEISSFELKEELQIKLWENLIHFEEKKFKIIAPNKAIIHELFYHISTEELLPL